MAVEGTSDPALDLHALQKAVERGGTVLLKGRFDFGDKGSVTITKDVNVLGETNERGASSTTIRGGYFAFHSPLTEQTPCHPDRRLRSRTSISMARCGPAIRLAYASSVTITGNRITGVRPSPTPSGSLGRQQSILVGTALSDLLSGAQYHPGAVLGNVTITDNDIDLTTDAPTQTLAQGIFVMLTTGIHARIARNTITGCARNSIEVLDNYPGPDGAGFIVIQDNKIVTWNNHVVLEGREGSAITVRGSNAYIGRNKIERSGAFGLRLTPRVR